VLIKHEYECTVCKYSWDPDSFKNGNGDDKYKAGPEPAEVGAPEVTEPPPVDAAAAAPRKRNFAEVLTGFFE
jgi:hypothetical protein